MAEKKKKDSAADSGNGGNGGSGGNGGGKSGTATAKPKRASKTKPKQKPPQMLPPWKVLLHNDDKNEMMFVVTTIVELTTLNEQDAKQRTVEAHQTGVALLVVTHKERA